MGILNFRNSIGVLVFFMTTMVLAKGGMEAGGGIGVLCNSQLRVLDLYEAQEVHHLPIYQKYQDLDTNLGVYGLYIATYRSDSPPFYGEQYPPLPNDTWRQQELIKYLKQEVAARFIDIPTDTRLPITQDATLPDLPAGCSFVQIAIYKADGKIYRDREYWDLLSVQDQAALILHEGIYHQAKIEGARTSDQTRFVVGLAFAEKLPDPILKPTWGASSRVLCETIGQSGENFKFWSVSEVRNGNTGVGIYFERFKNFLQMERVSTFVSNMTTKDFFSSRYPLIQTPVHGDLFGETWTLEIKPDYQSGYGVQIRTTNNGEILPFSWATCKFTL